MSINVFLFPGQGAQYVGMGKDLYENSSKAKKLFDRANDLLGFNMSEICFSGDENELEKTNVAQAAIFTVSAALNDLLVEEDIEPSYTAGLSLGEYSALYSSGVISFEECIKILQIRGNYMQASAEETKGVMGALIGFAIEDINEEIENVKSLGEISIANYNCTGQIVITGEEEPVTTALKNLAESKKGRMTVPLKVSGAFHSRLMKNAGFKLYEDIKNISFKTPKVPYLSNVNAEIIDNTKSIADLLKRQVYSPVMFMQTLQNLDKQGCNNYIELGPGKALTGFVKKTLGRKTSTVSIQNFEDLMKFLSKK